MEARKKVIIDTDIGDDLDDAVALFCAMAEGMDILGITTVFRNTQARMISGSLPKICAPHRLMEFFFNKLLLFLS